MAERIAGFLGKANDQVQEACDYIASDPNLADGYHALGFSQVCVNKCIVKINVNLTLWHTFVNYHRVGSS